MVASDGHDLEHRPPVLDDVRDYLESRYGAGAARRLTETVPQAIIDGSTALPEAMTAMGAAAGGGAKKWFQFWR